MAIKTLYISDKKYRWESTIPLLDNNNFKEIIYSDVVEDYRTSLADIKVHNLQEVFPFVERIELVDFIDQYFNSFDTLDFELKFSIGLLFNELNKVKDKVNNIDVFEYIKIKNLNEVERPSEPTLWISGCSVTFGVGVLKEQTYGNLIAKKLSMPLINYAFPGTSIFWAVDTLLRSDIKAGDLVILGVTSIARYEYTKDWELKSKPCANATLLKFVDLDYFVSSTHILKCSRHILHLINFCNKIGAKIVVANLLDSTWLPIIFDKHPNFINLVYKVDDNELVRYIDLGTDNDHPGPLQHQHYADRIFEYINLKESQ